MTPEDRIKKLGSSDHSTPTEAEWSAFADRAHRSVTRRRVAGALGSLGVVLAVAVGVYVANDTPGQRRAPEFAASPTENPTPDTSPSSEGPEDTKPEMVSLQQWYVEDEKLMLYHGQFEKSQTPARDAIERLIAVVPGPLAEDGVESRIPPGTTLQELTIEDGTASVTFAGDFPDETDTQQRFAFAQVVYTLTQFPTVRDVSISWESVDSGGVASAPEGRKAYEELLPPIVVERPYAGEVVGKTFVISGIANVFEATVTYRLVEQNGNEIQGEVIQEGFTTATCGTGCWGTFEAKVTYEGDGDWAELQVFESSAEDGSPLNMVRIPLNFES